MYNNNIVLTTIQCFASRNTTADIQDNNGPKFPPWTSWLTNILYNKLLCYFFKFSFPRLSSPIEQNMAVGNFVNLSLWSAAITLAAHLNSFSLISWVPTTAPMWVQQALYLLYPLVVDECYRSCNVWLAL